jgi:hypothetical protein
MTSRAFQKTSNSKPEKPMPERGKLNEYNRDLTTTARRKLSCR